MEQSAEAVWEECLDIIRDNVSRQSFKTWFEPLQAESLEDEDDLRKLTVQLPSRFYYEWLEEHYFSLLRKTVTKVLGEDGRLFYDVVIEKEEDENGASMHLPARRPDSQSGDTRQPSLSEQGLSGPDSPSEPQDSPSEPPPSDASTSPPSAPPSDEAASPGEAQPDARPERQKPHASSQSSPQQSSPQQRASQSPSNRQGGPQRQGRRPQQRRQGQQQGRPQQGQSQQRPQQGAGDQEEEPPISNPFAIPGIRKAEVDSQLNDSYTFERFIEGDCNRLARSASWAIAQEPGGTSFNPFLVYGGVGLGKTHLIQAVGNHVHANDKVENVLYVSSERFTTEFVQSIQRNRISEFSMFYRQIDLLIVDDVQFFSGKEKTQEEFFHIFNALHQNGKQIVLSADRPPREIEGIEERLLSRFQWGLSADVQPPGLETRIAILQRKAEDDGIELDQEVIEFMAHNIKSNIRELEGALIKLLAHATLHKREIGLDLAKEVLRDMMQDVKVNLTIEEIQRIVCDYLNIEEDLVRAKTRKREVVRARQIAMYYSKKLTQHSLKTIGLHFGGRDHSTVIHANKTVEDQMETDEQFRETVEEIGRKIELRAR
jgi:chromosomal replication initiator protein